MAVVTDSELQAALPLVSPVVGAMIRRGQVSARLERDDLEAVGRVAVWKALQRIDPASAPRARNAYLAMCIRSAVIDYQRMVTHADGWHRRHGRVASIGSLDEALPGRDDGATVTETVRDPVAFDELLEHRERLAKARRVVDAMSGKLRVVAENLLAGEPRTLAAIGAQLGVTESRVCQLAREARERLRAAA